MESQTVTLEHKQFVPIDEYANREGISRRTANRYAKIGKIQTAKHKGRTMVIDKPIEPEPIMPKKDNQESQTRQQSGQIELFGQQQWFELGKLTIRAKSRQTWQFLAITSFVLIVTILGLSGWLFLERQVKTERLDLAQTKIMLMTEQSGQSKIHIADLRNKLQIQQAESIATVGRLQNQISELTDKLLFSLDSGAAVITPGPGAAVIPPGPGAAGDSP